MKLSVKLLSGLSLIALVAVAVVTLSQSANAAADGKVYVTNKASGLTTEPSTAVDGRTSATTVYGTFVTTGTGTSDRDIVADSDKIIVTVIDEDVNSTTTVTTGIFDADTVYSAESGGSTVAHGSVDGTGTDAAVGSVSGLLAAPGDISVLTLTGTDTSPIVGSISDVKIFLDNGTTAVTNVSVKSINYAGDGQFAPIITIGLDHSGINAAGYVIKYPTSITDTLTVAVKSVVDPTGTTLLLTETDRDTGRFEGTIRVDEYASGVVGVANTSIPASGGLITVNYNDVATSGVATNVNRTATYSIDTTIPTVSIATPANDGESQNRLPSFSGSAIDAQSGLDVSTFGLFIDEPFDTGNTTMVIDHATGSVGSSTPAAIDYTSLGADGTNSFNWTFSQTTPLPTGLGATVPDNDVDFQAKVSDLAGNIGYSDSDATDDVLTTGRFGNQPHIIKIDQKIPSILSAASGVGLDTTGVTPVDKPNVRDTIKVVFDGNVKDSSVSASDFKVTLSGAGGTFVPASILIDGANVYLDIDSTIPSDNTPTVTLQGTVQDVAGNSTDAGSAVADDLLDPVLTVTRSAGTGTGTDSEAADSLTKKNMTFTVTSDEDLNGPPTVTLTEIGTAPAIFSGLPTSLGSNVWSVTHDASTTPGNIAVQVVGQDTSTNVATIGDLVTKAYTVDNNLPTATSTPAGTTTQSNPFLTSDFGLAGETASVSIESATLDDVDVTSSLIASADSKTFFFQPATALTNASHTYIVKAIDAAGNQSTTTTTFTKSDRTDFVVELFAGWNSVSLPSSPLDTDVNSVLSNSGVKQVVAYDATTPSQPWRIASKVGSAAFTSQTTPGLTSVTAGPGYWIESSDFEDQKVALEGPTGPGDARPGLTTIATGNGWNLVGVVDQSRLQTQLGDNDTQLSRPGSGVVISSKYFNTVQNGRAYTFDTVTSKFIELIDADHITIGEGIWVFISPQGNGQLPHIVP